MKLINIAAYRRFCLARFQHVSFIACRHNISLAMQITLNQKIDMLSRENHTKKFKQLYNL